MSRKRRKPAPKLSRDEAIAEICATATEGCDIPADDREVIEAATRCYDACRSVQHSIGVVRQHVGRMVILRTAAKLRYQRRIARGQRPATTVQSPEAPPKPTPWFKQSEWDKLISYSRPGSI